MLYSQRAWNQAEDGDRIDSTYSVARSETPSDYSKRAWDSTASLDEDLIQDRPDSYAPSSHTHNAFGENRHDTVDTLQTEDARMSVLGPKTTHFMPAPWEPGGEDLVEEEEDLPEAETRSLFGGKSRQKKSKDAPSKPRIFPASFAPRASSSSRPSVDVSTPTSSSSGGGRPRPPVRPGSSGTQYSIVSDAVPFPAHNRHEPRSAVASPKTSRRDNLDNEVVASPSHPYANPRYAASQYYDDTASVNYPPSPASVYPPSMYASKPPSVGHASQPQHVSVPPDMPPPPSSQAGIPQKMSPWQYTPGSPTFQLVSLEEAQALRARQRQMSLGAVEHSEPRTRTVSGPTSRKSMLPIEHSSQPTAEPMTETSPGQVKTLKGRRSLMGLFAKGKEKGTNSRSESPPPVPSIPNRAATTPMPQTPSLPVETPPMAGPQDFSQQRTLKRPPPPALNVVVTSPQPQIAHPYREQQQYPPPPPIPSVQKSATPPPSFQQRSKQVPRKQSSAQTLSPSSETRSPMQKPNSAPSTIQGFSGLSIRPVSTMFSSMPLDYLASPSLATPVPPVPASNLSGQSMTQSPTTPSLWSSRSESVSTGSLDMPPSTPGGGLVHSLSSGSSMEAGNTASLSLLQKQVYGARDVWKSQVADLEAQVRALKSEVAALKEMPCPSCGHFGGGSSCTEKTSVLNRPRAKTAAYNQRFGGE